MVQVNGKIKFVNSDAKGDSIVLEDDTRIYLGKGEGRLFFGKKGGTLTGEAEERTSKAGNVYLITKADKLQAEGGKPLAVVSGTTDFNTRAARGQALNLAMQLAIAQGKSDDDDYILSLIPRMLKLGAAAQKDPEPKASTDESVSADVF